MSQLVPFRSLLRQLNHWPNVFDDDELAVFSHSPNSEVDVYETKNEVVAKANVAGVSPEDVTATFEKGVLWIQAKASQESSDSEHKYYSKSSWNYSYKIAIPGFIDHAKEPTVTLKDGILTAVFQKTEASKPKKLTISNK